MLVSMYVSWIPLGYEIDTHIQDNNNLVAKYSTVEGYWWKQEQNESTGVQNPRRPIITINMQDTSGGGGGGGEMVSPTALSKIMYASAVYNVH